MDPLALIVFEAVWMRHIIPIVFQTEHCEVLKLSRVLGINADRQLKSLKE